MYVHVLFSIVLKDELKELHRVGHEHMEEEAKVEQLKRSGSGMQDGGKQAHSAPSRDTADAGTGPFSDSFKEELEKGEAVKENDPPRKDGEGSHCVKEGKSASEED